MSSPRCYEMRGCDEELWSRCPHAVASVDGMCPLQCNFTNCRRPERRMLTGLDLLSPSIDRSLTVKEVCWYCRYFLENTVC